MIGVDQSLANLTVSVLGGTGRQGRGLARRFAEAGIPVVIGSRSQERADQTALTLARATEGPVSAATNEAAARAGDVVIVAVPWEGHGELLEKLADALADKIVVDCVNPLGFDRRGAYALHVEEGSAAEQAAAILSRSRVVAAFHHVSAARLEDPMIESVATDVLVLGEDRDATNLIQSLVDAIPGLRGRYGGRLRNARDVEALTADLISIHRHRKVRSGLRVTESDNYLGSRSRHE
jgi:NADPH-dependent F420 reductase